MPGNARGGWAEGYDGHVSNSGKVLTQIMNWYNKVWSESSLLIYEP